MKNEKNRFFVLIIFFQYTIAFSQVQTPTIKDPRVEAFSIFGDIPVSHITGVPDISIPLFNIESHGYTLPVTLRYHTALVKPPFDHTNVATGWILEIGGNVVQNIKGENDFLGRRPASWKNDYELTDETQESTQNYLFNVFNNQYDCEYDIFSYSFPGSNGKFIVNKGSSGKYDAVFLSDPAMHGNVEVTIGGLGLSYSVNSFLLTDTKGYKYSYEKKTYTHIDVDKYPYYMLNKIYTSNGLELFNFSYSTSYNVTNQLLFQNYIFHHDWSEYFLNDVYGHKDEFGLVPPTGFSVWPSTLLEQNWTSSTINKVEFENGRLDFTLTSDNRFISAIYLRNSDGNIIKKVEFVSGNFPGSGYRYLDKIIIKDKNSIEGSEYSFDYYNKTMEVNNSALNVDYWGYLTTGSRGVSDKIDIEQMTLPYNRAIGIGEGTMPDNLTMGFSSNRQPNLYYTQTYVLKKIIYPTKGSTEFSYELNQYVDNMDQVTIKDGGGLRIEKIINKDENNNQVSVKTYQYEPGNVDFSFSDNGDNFKTTYVFQAATCSHYVTYATRTQNVNINNGIINPEKSKDIRYSKVTELNGTSTGNSGKTTYEYEFSNPHYYQWFDLIYNQDKLILGGNTWQYILEYRDWDNGQLDKKTIFKNNGNSYDIVMTEEYIYSKTDLQTFTNLKTFRYANYGESTVNLNEFYHWMHWYETAPTLGSPVPLIPYNYTIKSGVSRLTSKITTQYNDDGTHVSTKEMYNFSNGMDKFMTSHEVTNSDNKITKTSFKYPYDISSDVNTEMVKRNMIGPVLEETSEVGNLKVKGTKTTYGFLDINGFPSASSSQASTAFILPFEIYELDKNAVYYRRYTYDKYTNKENLLQYHKEDGINTIYIWGYNQTYPVVKIVGKTYADIPQTVKDAITSHTFSGSTTYSSIAADMAYIKTQLATLLSDATCMVTFYTYAPLIGMTSQTDPNGVTTYFEYDTFGRLKYLRDDDGHILKAYEYHYKQ